MTTPESRTVERLAAIKRRDAAWSGAEFDGTHEHPETQCSADHDRHFLLAAAKEHGLVIGEGELDRAWKEAEAALDSRGDRFAMLRRYGDTYGAWWIKKEDGKLDGVEGQPTPTAALKELAKQLRESRR